MMKQLAKIFLMFWVFAFFCIKANATIIFTDSTPTNKIDTVAKKAHNPKLALKRSAMLPGWGQVYNKQTWKVPIIYAALGITTYIFFDNLKTYKEIRFAYNARLKASGPPPRPPLADTRDFNDIPKIKPYLVNLDINGLNVNRRRFRQQIDYSVLFFVVFWGLNMADAVVFAHLKDFDVSDNISGNIKIGNSSLANTTGLSLNFDIHKKKTPKLFTVK